MFSIRIHAGNTIQSPFHTALEDDPIGDTDIRNIYVDGWLAGWLSDRQLQAGVLRLRVRHVGPANWSTSAVTLI